MFKGALTLDLLKSFKKFLTSEALTIRKHVSLPQIPLLKSMSKYLGPWGWGVGWGDTMRCIYVRESVTQRNEQYFKITFLV